MLQLVPVTHLERNPLMDLNQLHEQLQHAADTGALAAGHAGVIAGANHLDHPAASLLAPEHIDQSLNGQLTASVTATAQLGEQPYLASTDSTADAMTQAAVEAALKAIT